MYVYMYNTYICIYGTWLKSYGTWFSVYGTWLNVWVEMSGQYGWQYDIWVINMVVWLYEGTCESKRYLMNFTQYECAIWMGNMAYVYICVCVCTYNVYMCIGINVYINTRMYKWTIWVDIRAHEAIRMVLLNKSGQYEWQYKWATSIYLQI